MFCLRNRLGSAAFTALVVFSMFFIGSNRSAFAHDAKSGWRYPFACCASYDCREVPAKAIIEGPQGYVIAGTGELLTYRDSRVRNSPDGEFHWCSVAGASDGKTVCLFVPPRSY